PDTPDVSDHLLRRHLDRSSRYCSFSHLPAFTAQPLLDGNGCVSGSGWDVTQPISQAYFSSPAAILRGSNTHPHELQFSQRPHNYCDGALWSHGCLLHRPNAIVAPPRVNNTRSRSNDCTRRVQQDLSWCALSDRRARSDG